MKKFLLILFIILNFCNGHTIISSGAKASSFDPTTAESSTNYGYYKVLSSCPLFKTSDITNTTLDNIYFIVPETYFVKKISDISASTIKVSYSGKIGYVMTERVRLVSFLPNEKYLKGITFDISKLSGTQMWSTPSSNDMTKIIFKHIEAGTTNISYIASTNGEIPPGATSPVWYYCTFSPANDPTSVYEGYIHSEKTTNLSQILENSEDDKVYNELSQTTKTLFGLPKSIETILIVFVSIPLLSTIVIIYLNSRRKNKQKSMNETDFNDTQHQFASINKSQKSNNSISKFRGKKYSMKEKFDNFMFESSQNTTPSNQNKFKFSNLDIIDDDDLL